MQLNSIWTAMPLAEKGAAAFVPVMVAVAFLVTSALRRSRTAKQSRKAETATTQRLLDLFKNQWVGILSAIISFATLYLNI
jgi:hypothetical protein